MIDHKFNNQINNLNKLHNKKNLFYRNYIKFFKKKIINKNIEDQPFLHTDVFKNTSLMSIKEKEIFKIISSSGTSGQIKSKIFLDIETSKNQQLALNDILKPILGKKRLPMLIIDNDNIIKKKTSFTARSAAIRGFSIFSKKNFFLLNQDMSVNKKVFKKFINNYQNEKFVVFGFTFLVWNNFFNKIDFKIKKNIFKNSLLIHGGGWKKLEDIKISNKKFNKLMISKFNFKQVINYYGLAEQAGSIFLECEYNNFHTTKYSNILIRDKNFEVANYNSKGLIQLISTIPKSYPGHNILTSDIGEILGNNSCPCGRRGKYFRVYGRLSESEIRGCSDTI